MRRARPELAASLLAFGLLAGALGPRAASADCTRVGDDVTCSGVDADGFDAGADDGLTVVVEDLATVGNPAGDAIRLNDGSDVTVESGGAVSASAAGAAAIRAGAGDGTVAVTIEAGASATSSGLAGAAISVGDGYEIGGEAGVINGGALSSTGDDSTVLSIGDGSHALNSETGVITIGGADSAGMVGGIGSELENRNRIESTRDGAVGMRIGADGILRNRGTIELIGDDVVGIDAIGTILFTTNDDRIDLTGDRATGIRFDDDTRGPGVTAGNRAEITIRGADAIGILAGDRSDLFNNGVLTIDNPGQPSGTGVQLGAESQFDNFATIRVDATDGVGLRLVGADNLVVNDTSGIIEATTAILSTAGGQRIDNLGTIVGDIRLSGGDQLFQNFGSLTGDIVFGAGDDTLTLIRAVDGSVDLGAGDDTLQLDGTSDRLTGPVSGGSQTTADLVLLRGGRGAAFDLDTVSDFEALEIELGSWRLGNTGSFQTTTVRSGAALRVDGTAVGGPGGVTQLDGDVIFEDGSTLTVEIDPTGDQGRLVASGDILTGTGVVLDVVTAGALPVGSSFQLASAASIGEFVFPSLAFLDVSRVARPGGVDLVLSQLAYADGVESSNQRALGGHLDAITTLGATGDLAALLGELSPLDPAAARAAFDTLHAEPYDAHSSTMLAGGFALASLVGRERLHCDRQYEFQLYGRDRVQPSPCGRRGRALWADGFVEFAERDTKAGQIDYDATSGAVVVGADWMGRDWLTSFFLGTTITSLEIDGIGDGDVTSLEVGARWNRRFRPFRDFGSVRLQTIALYGHGFHEQDRRSTLR